MEATFQQFDALGSPGCVVGGHVDGLARRMMAKLSSSEDAAVKVTVNNSLIQPRGLSAASRMRPHTLRGRPREGHPATLASRGPRCGDPYSRGGGYGSPLSRGRP